MIQLISNYPKAVALFLISLFYCDFLLAASLPVKRFQENSSNQNNKNYPTYSPENNLSFQTEAQESLSSLGNEQEYNYSIDKAGFNQFAAEAEEDEAGPTQPEMQAFQSVNNSNMVDLFNGDFSYNIPLMDVGGYPINIGYRSGISMDQDASWVGLGWNINPGTITRNLRGLPDDFKGSADTIKKTTSIKENQTVGVTVGADLELIGLPLDLGTSVGIFHNNYRGWGLERGISASLNAGRNAKGPLSAGLSITNNTQQGLTLSPSLSLNLGQKDVEEKGGLNGGLTTSFAYNSRGGIRSLNFDVGPRLFITGEKNVKEGDKVVGTQTVAGGSTSGGLSPAINFATLTFNPTISQPYTSTQFTFTAKIGFETPGAVHPNLFASGYVSKQSIKPEDQTLALPAYGYMNYQSAANNASVLLDFNREKEIPYNETPPVPNIAVPSYTYDAFSITGEGTGGMFRAYRGDIGFVFDHHMKTKDESNKFSIDLGFGNLIHAGVDLNQNSSYTQSGPWLSQNTLKDVVAFRDADSTFEAVYFKNPGEKSINSTAFYNAIGGDDVVTAQLYQAGTSSPYISTTNYLNRFRNKSFVGTTLLNASNVVKRERDKRTQVITYLTAEDASTIGLSKNIENYAANRWGLRNCNKDFPPGNTSDTLKINDTLSIEKRVSGFRKANHISEIDVLNADGRRYVYGIPVYNLLQREATFSVNRDSANRVTGLVRYGPGNDGTGNGQGIDHYFNQEETPAYAHSFLLTGILSNDYVDLTADGISDDDLGDAVKFNYSKVSGIKNPFKWRAPYIDSATYNESLLTNFRDEKGSYIYGEKELWYLNSIESKTMLATFKVEERKDLLPINKSGNKDTASNGNPGAKLLKEINLYTKAEYLKKGAAATPIKTVHFQYTYELCTGINKASPSNYKYKDSGKLTLKRIWFTYNGNRRNDTLNPYVFNYKGINPSYNAKSYDRWGNYKDPLQNPGSAQTNTITNAEYPYALQDSALTAANASAWTLDSIILPSGGRIKVDYESDDYAYVQNRRAMQMFKMEGFGFTKTSSPLATLYTTSGGDNLYVFVHSDTALTNKQDLYYKYLQGIEKIYFKIFVKMPSDLNGYGSEYIPCYADLDTGTEGGYGLVNANKFWIKIKGIDLEGTGDGTYSPLAKAAIQFLRLNLPGKAFPNSEVGDNLGIKEAVNLVKALGSNIITGFSTFDKTARNKPWCTSVDLNRSFIRLDNPLFKRYGGGLRVKRIKIYDNWTAMTRDSGVNNTGQKQSVYGQEYTYTTTKEINGIKTAISSGVASYEPMIGGEENPFHQPLRYYDKAAPLAPVTLGYVEEPLGESFFPAPGVGYSKVRVRSINTQNRKSANGYEETSFYTAYDFPTLVDNSMLDGNSKKRYKPALANFLRINAKNYISISQGFKIELNDMHGRMKSQATFPENDPDNPIAYTENFYKVDNQNAEFKHLANTVSVINPQGEIDTTAIIGKDAEVMMDMREQQSVTEGNNYGLNLDLFLIGIFPIPLPSDIPLPQREEDIYRSVATTKVIQRYAILDSVVQIDKGSKVSTKNILYDSETGAALLTRTNNEFNDPVYNFSYPSHWAYSGMGLAYKNINAVFSSEENNKITINDGIAAYSDKYPNFSKFFESGDEILATGRVKMRDSILTDCNGIQTSCKTGIFDATIASNKIWAVDAKKIDSNGIGGIIFLKQNGDPFSGTDLSLKIIRSGKRNISAVPLETVTCLKNPIIIKSGKLQLLIDSSTLVINSNAAIFKDNWKVADEMYLKDTFYVTMKDTTISKNPTVTILKTNYHGENGWGPNIQTANSSYVISCYDHFDGGFSCNSKSFFSKNILKFDITQIPNAATILNATISFTPKIPTGFDLPPLGNNGCGEVYDFNTATSYNSGTNTTTTSYLKAITSSWNASTSYLDFDNIISENNKVLIDYSHYSNIVCKDLITYMLNNNYSSNGIMFENLKNSYSSNNGSYDQLNYLSFYSSDATLSNRPTLNIEYVYPDTTRYSVCRSAITQNNINPYAYGLLGNWRAKRNFTFYNERQQSDPSIPTVTRKDGALKAFTPYWSFSSTYLNPTSDTIKWVWNSETTIFNKKGSELENKDPLGRYNSGQYGYNQTLPVSVTQNSKYREQLFDGLEDYLYKNQNCSVACSVPREVDFLKDHAVLDTAYRHSGRYSLKINAGDSSGISFKVISKDIMPLITQNYTIHKFENTLVDPNGNGVITTTGYLQNDLSHPNDFKCYVQTQTTGYYKMSSPSSCNGDVTNGVVTNIDVGVSVFPSDLNNAGAYLLKAGQLYEVKSSCASGRYVSSGTPPSLQWAGPCPTNTTSQYISSLNIYNYNDTSLSHNTVSYSEREECKEFVGAYTDSSELITSFTPTASNKLWLSAWVHEDTTCLCQSFSNNQISLITTDSAGNKTTVIAKPSGNVIDGWQRYDYVFEVPANAANLSFKLKATGANNVYFDDLRVHPFNAIMKSFVYDPLSLRLMAELDENNYATFYEYDDDGTLIRVKKETQKGVKTIKETRSYLFKEGTN